MPLVARAAVAYAAGLALGLTCSSRVAMAAASVGLVTALWSARHPKATLAPIAILAVAGVLLGLADVRRSARCAERLVAAREWRVTFDAPVQAGGVGRAVLSANGCEAHATLLVSSGRADAGSVATVKGIAS